MDLEIILIDNNSGGDDCKYLSEKFNHRIRLVCNQENIGFGRANNQGAAIATGEYLFFLNSDTVLEGGALKELVDFFNSRSDIGILAPKLLLADGRDQPFAFGDYPTFKSVLSRRKSLEYRKMPFAVDWVSGAAFIIKKELFEKAGGFDENFFMYFEDIDLCKRVKVMGYSNMIMPSASLFHLGGKSTGNFSRKKMYYKSQAFYFKKHFGLCSMLILKLIRWPYKIYNLISNS